MPTTSKYQLVLEAQEDQVLVIADCRIALREALDEMNQIGGEDDYQTSLPAFLAKYKNGETTTTDILRDVYPDARKLKKAVAKLHMEGKINAETKGQTTFITLVKVETPNAEPAENDAASERQPDDKRQAAPASRRR